MLSDEEKAVLKTAKENYGLTSVEQKILVNLIEKQSKEIEELKDKCKELYNPSDMILRYYDTKKGTQVEIKGFVPTDKIKAKIEYYEKIDNPVGKRVLQSLLEKE